MSVRTVDAVINDKSYSFNTFTAKRGLNILRRLTTVIGPSMSKVISGAEGDELDMSFLDDAIKELVLRLDDDGIETLVQDMTKDVQSDNKPISFDLEFAGNYGTLMQLVMSIVKENYSSLFTESGIGGLNL